MSVSQNLKERLFHAISTRAEVEEIISLLEQIGSGGGVSELNGETGEVTLTEGSNITITPDGNGNIEIASAAGGDSSEVALLVHTSTNSIPSAAFTKVTFNTAVTNLNSAYSSGTWTAYKDGVVMVSTVYTWSGTTAPELFVVSIVKNGTIMISDAISVDSTSFNSRVVTMPIDVLMNDTIEIRAFQNTGSPMSPVNDVLDTGDVTRLTIAYV